VNVTTDNASVNAAPLTGAALLNLIARGQISLREAKLIAALQDARQELRYLNVAADGGQRANTAAARVLRDIDAAIAAATGSAA
jgi:hypothetical protein